jgi:cystathionine beta-lyase/cystathionine gamma-synthase
MAAISTVILGLCQSGDRIVCVRHVYPDSYRLMRRLLPRFGIAVEFVDGGDPVAVARARPGARLLYLESPSSCIFGTQELARLAALARSHRVVSVIDNSWASPIFQRPLEHGIDLVLHSASKYLGGHSDVVASVVAGSRELITGLDETAFPYLGAKLSPLDAWLLVRGLRTLPLRMRRHHESGLAIADRLAGHPPSYACCTRRSPTNPAAPRRPAGPACSPSSFRNRKHPRLLQCAADVQARRQLGRP